MVITESLCKFDGENTRLEYGESTRKRCANLRNIYGTFVEKQIWRNYVDLTRWKITDWKNQRRAKIEGYAKPTVKVEKCFGKL